MWQKKPIVKMKWMPLPRTERTESLNNPYCGFYTLYRFFAEQEHLQPEGKVIEEVQLREDQQLCLLEINLIHFREEPLTEKALWNIKRIFSYFTEQNKQMILRFVYDWEGKGIINEPKDISVILKHMSQLSPLLKEYTRTIYILQGLFIGSWGEMHSSRFLNERNMTLLAKQLYDCSGEKTQIALRCPSFWRMLFKTYQPLDMAAAFTDIQKARFALFNDAIMASEDDYGSYGSSSIRNAKSYADKWIRREELEFQKELCLYVSNGGEVINDCSLNDAAPAIDTLSKMRVSYLHCNYDEKVLKKWKESKAASGNVLWKDKSAYEYIAAHLGYRFTLQDANLSMLPDQSGNLRASVKIANLGFAPCYHEFTVKFVVRSSSFQEVYEYGIDTDTRCWMPEDSLELEAVLPAQDLKSSNYILCLGIYDPRSAQPIAIANTFSTADHMGLYRLGNFIL